MAYLEDYGDRYAAVGLGFLLKDVMSKAEGLSLQPPTNLAAGLLYPGARMRADILS
jgi:hypothetical protein